MTPVERLLVFRRGWKDGASGHRSRTLCERWVEYRAGFIVGQRARQSIERRARLVFIVTTEDTTQWKMRNQMPR